MRPTLAPDDPDAADAQTQTGIEHLLSIDRKITRLETMLDSLRSAAQSTGEQIASTAFAYLFGILKRWAEDPSARERAA